MVPLWPLLPLIIKKQQINNKKLAKNNKKQKCLLLLRHLLVYFIIQIINALSIARKKAEIKVFFPLSSSSSSLSFNLFFIFFCFLLLFIFIVLSLFNVLNLLLFIDLIMMQLYQFFVCVYYSKLLANSHFFTHVNIIRHFIHHRFFSHPLFFFSFPLFSVSIFHLQWISKCTHFFHLLLINFSFF